MNERITWWASIGVGPSTVSVRQVAMKLAFTTTRFHINAGSTSHVTTQSLAVHSTQPLDRSPHPRLLVLFQLPDLDTDPQLINLSRGLPCSSRVRPGKRVKSFREQIHRTLTFLLRYLEAISCFQVAVKKNNNQKNHEKPALTYIRCVILRRVIDIAHNSRYFRGF